tara:strand:+ start:248 stop:550 length:303 start_codon:yes stop_codon:yes gene_type:complete
MKTNRDYFNILQVIQKKPLTTQRVMARRLGFSLGKMNYCLQALNKKKLIKIKNFKKSKNKLDYIYLLTPKGISLKLKLTINYMRKISKEYDELKKDFIKG